MWHSRPVTDYRDDNRANWDERVPAHVASAFYGVPRFLAEPDYLSDVVRFDLPLLGDVAGPARRAPAVPHRDRHGVAGPARRVDDRARLLRPAVEAATRLAAATGADATFVQSDVYAAADVLGAGAFDLVYTGIGALCWLPDIRRWAGVVAALLRPGGRLFIREGHPMLWTLDDRDDDLLVKYPYFEQPEPLTWTEGGTYVDTDAVFEQNVSHEWNHGLGEIVTALLDEGLALTGLVEHDSVPWNAFPGRMEQIEGSEWRLADRPARLAHSYTLQAVKPPR